MADWRGCTDSALTVAVEKTVGGVVYTVSTVRVSLKVWVEEGTVSKIVVVDSTGS